MMTADSQKALVTTKAYDGVRKDRNEETILLMTFWIKILMEIFDLALNVFGVHINIILPTDLY